MARDELGDARGFPPGGGEPWIDTVSKALARPTSRRSMLKVLAGGLAASMLGLQPLAQTALAATTSIPSYCPTCAPCQACNIDTATNTTTCGSCPSGCPGTTLCAQSSVNTSYKKLMAYLDNLGLQPKKEPAPNQTKRNIRAMLLSQDGLRQVSTLGLALSNPTQPALTANLFYTVQNNAPASVAIVFLNGALSYILYTDGSGQVQKQLPPSASATT